MLIIYPVSLIIGALLGFGLKSWIVAEGGLKNMFDLRGDEDGR